jgi:hypothetical protein
MNAKQSQIWNSENLVKFATNLSSGFLPGNSAPAPKTGDTWTTERHLQVAKMRAQAYLWL